MRKVYLVWQARQTLEFVFDALRKNPLAGLCGVWQVAHSTVYWPATPSRTGNLRLPPPVTVTDALVPLVLAVALLNRVLVAGAMVG